MSAAPRGPGPVARQRIDKWLWHARVVRTRTTAQGLARSGHVRLNGERVTDASATVRQNDVLTIALPERALVLVVRGFAERRGSATEASLLYDDQSPPPAPRPAVDAPRTPGSGRPTKRERRQTDRLKRDDGP